MTIPSVEDLLAHLPPWLAEIARAPFLDYAVDPLAADFWHQNHTDILRHDDESDDAFRARCLARFGAEGPATRIAPEWMKRRPIWTAILADIDAGKPLLLPWHYRKRTGEGGDPCEQILEVAERVGARVVNMPRRRFAARSALAAVLP